MWFSHFRFSASRTFGFAVSECPALGVLVLEFHSIPVPVFGFQVFGFPVFRFPVLGFSFLGCSDFRSSKARNPAVERKNPEKSFLVHKHTRFLA